MKFKAILPILFISLSSFAGLDSVSISGTFVNDEGCRAYNVDCMNIYYDNGESYNSCSLELYIDDEYSASLKKGGKVTKTEGDLITGRDRGLRSTIIILPEWKNTKAEFKILESYNDPSTFSEVDVSKFDITMKKGIFGKSYTCKNMVFEPYED